MPSHRGSCQGRQKGDPEALGRVVLRHPQPMGWGGQGQDGGTPSPSADLLLGLGDKLWPHSLLSPEAG